LIDVLTEEALADDNDVIGAVALTYVLWDKLRRTQVVADCHSITADATHGQAL